MKKTLALAAAVLALAAFAKTERLLTVQVAGVEGLVAAATQIGTMSGNTLVGLMVSSSVSKMPGVDTFGTGRPGAAMTFVAYGDPEKLATEKGRKEDIPYALVYPVAIPKEEFLSANPGVKEKDGVVTLSEGKMRKVVFSADGRWAAMAEKASWAKKALADASAYTRSAGRSAMRLSVEPAAFKVVDGFLGEEIAKEKKDAKRRAELQAYAGLVASIARAELSFDVSGNGIDLGFRATAKKGTELSRFGLTSLGADPLAFAPAGALSASALAENCGGSDIRASWNQLVEAFRAEKIDLPRLVTVSFAGTRSIVELDCPSCFAYCQECATNGTFGAFDATRFGERLSAIGDGEAVTAKGPAQESAFILKGFRPKYAPAQRFAAAMPDLKDRKPFSVGVMSVYALIRGLAGPIMPFVTASLPRAQKTSFEALVMSLPEDVNGGVASAIWRDGDDLTGLLRFSAAEVKGLAAFVNVGIAFTTMQRMSQPPKRAKAKAKSKGNSKEKAKSKAKARPKAKTGAEGRGSGRTEGKAREKASPAK